MEGSGSVHLTSDSGGECGVAYKTYFPVSMAGKDKPWYSIESAIIISTEHDWTQNSEQIFTTAIGLYYIQTEEAYLYTPLSGFHGVVAGFLLGIKQIIPDQELVGNKAKWLPTIIGFVSSAISFFIEGSATYIPIIIFGIYISCIYLQYFQKKSESGLKGDPSDEFSFSNFFSGFMWPILNPVALIFDQALCGRTRNFGESANGSMDASHLPGSDPIEAMTRSDDRYLIKVLGGCSIGHLDSSVHS